MAEKKPQPAPTLQEQNSALLSVLRRYVHAYPAWRTKPIGAPHSPARREQDQRIALEDAAIAAIKDATGDKA